MSDVDIPLEKRYLDQYEFRWDDLRFPAQGINPPGGANDPDVDATTGLLLFASNVNEVIAGVAQLPHDWLEECELRPHVHWQKTTSAAGDVVWLFEYEVVNNFDVAAMDYGTALQASEVAGTGDDNTANRVLITPLGSMAMPDKRISCLVFWRLTRNTDDAGDTYGADARLIELDFHYVRLGQGSRQEFIKETIEA